MFALIETWQKKIVFMCPGVYICCISKIVLIRFETFHSVVGLFIQRANSLL